MTEPPEDPASVVAEHAPTAQCLLRDGLVVYANGALGELLGIEPSELEGRPFGDFVAEGDAERVVGELAAADDECTLRFELDGDARRGNTVESRWRIARGDGPPATLSADPDDAQRLVGTLEEATERLELERESEMLESALANLPLSIYFKDRQSRHERVSDHMLCQDEDSVITNGEGKRHPHPEDVIGKTDFDIYSSGIAEGAIAEDERIMETEEPVFNEVTESTTSLGETFFSSTTKAPRYDENGDVVGIVGVTMDVTERTSYGRELERQNERMEEFTEVLTHDLRNPLTVATGYGGLLAERYDDPEADKLTDALARMSALITQLRTFVLEGRTVESPEPMAVAAVARDAWECVETRAAALDVSATHTIRADDCRVQQLFENLVRNAVEHGRADVTVTVGDLPDGFYVADDGPGIPAENQAHVFDRGFSTNDDSTGFGLAIVKNIADAHDWSVTVTDADGGGAQFEFHDVVRVEGDGPTQG